MNAVADALARFILALDDRDWDTVTEWLGETVRIDYTSLFEGEPETVAGPELVARWQGLLTGLDGHQHLLGPAVIDVDGDEARAQMHVTGTHALDGDSWVVGGTYRMALRRSDRWRIVAITLDTRWQTGDAAILERA